MDTRATDVVVFGERQHEYVVVAQLLAGYHLYASEPHPVLE